MCKSCLTSFTFFKIIKNISSIKFLNKYFFVVNTISVAKALLGKVLVYGKCSGIIVETEAYRDDDASHAVTRPNKGVMLRETFGCIYIYFIYGMYHCLNFTTEENGVGAVLIRAMEPLTGFEEMTVRRHVDKNQNLTNGPGKLFNAFGFDPKHHGEEVGSSIKITEDNSVSNFEISSGPRIGISKAVDLNWRFYIKDNKFVSR